MNKIIIAIAIAIAIVIVIAVVVLAGGYFLINRSNPVQAPANAPVQNPAPANQPSASVSGSKTWAVTIQNFAFAQPSLIIKKGDTVVWTDKDSAPHTVTVDSDGGPVSPTLNQNGTYSFTFNTAGTFGYHCSIHPFMKGTVTVQ